MTVNKKLNILSAFLLFAGSLSGSVLTDSVTIIDSRHYSSVFGEIRNYRVFLPPRYFEEPQKQYPVIYFYHGWSQRFFGSGPDGYNHFEKGNDNNGDNIEAFVSKNEVIVVKPDGYNRSRDEEYYLRPYNIGPVETSRQFPLYFPELVKHIDATYRTIPDRNHRAISGLSMGGFMSFWIGGKYPDMICAIGNFCGSAEFVIGPKDFPVEYRNIDISKNYDGVKVRLNYGNEDFIRYYHRDLNKVWLQLMDNYEYEVYNTGHVTCGMGEMFSFISSVFKNPPQKPVNWGHIDVYPDFSVWDYTISTNRDIPGFTILEKVNNSGFKCSVRQHLPDGEILSFVQVTVKTPPLYKKNTTYRLNDIDLTARNFKSYNLRSDNNGCLELSMNGNLHEIGINESAGKPNISLSSFSITNMKYARHQADVRINISLLNKGIIKGEGVKATLIPFRKSSIVTGKTLEFGTIDINETKKSEADFVFRTTSDTTVVEKFKVVLTDLNRNSWEEFIEVPVFRSDLPVISDFRIADGRKMVIASRGTDTDTLVLGNGNGDGIANPGESVVILVNDGGILRRAELVVKDEFLDQHGENKRYSDYWGTYDHVGGSAKYSEAVISSSCPQQKNMSVVVEYWLPDSPNHIIKQGIVNFSVSGKDKTPPFIDWYKIREDNTVMVKFTEGSSVSSASVKIVEKKDPLKFFVAELNDSGQNGDQEKNDRIFSAKIPIRGFGFYSAEINAEDLYSNGIKLVNHGPFVIH